jgi:hypothetical protein
MANFGYSIGDFILLLDLSRRVIKSYQDAPKQFQDISTEVKGLNTVLNRTKEVIDHATESFGTDLRHLAEGCHEVLNDANTLLEQFQGCFPKPADATPLSALTRLTESSDTGLLGKFLRIKNKSKKVRGRFRWDESAVAALRMRIMVNTTLMMAYNTCVQR